MQFLNQILKINQILTFEIHPKYQGEDELSSSDFKSHILLESGIFGIFKIVKKFFIFTYSVSLMVNMNLSFFFSNFDDSFPSYD